MKKIRLISLHGGHSGQFCNHAKDSLEDIIRQYIRLGFLQVGICEHIPPSEDRFLFPDEIEKKITVPDLTKSFSNYFKTLNLLKKQYKPLIHIFIGMEIETYSGYADHVRHLEKTFCPDYIVGSVHHVDDRCFDYSKQEYDSIARDLGSVENMYLRYFDLQYEMIQTLKPFLVGHFDLIRIYDPDYKTRIENPEIGQKIQRNLNLIKELGLVMDLNLRPLARNEEEPYPTRSILEKARNLGISMVPGDDSHGIAQAGGHVRSGIKILDSMGFDTKWKTPTVKE